MMNKNFKSILLGTTIFCICSVVAVSAGATNIDLNNKGATSLFHAISLIHTEQQAGNTGSYVYTLPSSNTTQTIVDDTIASTQNLITSINNPNKLTINGNSLYNQVIQGTLAIVNPSSGTTGKGKLTFNNVGSFTEEVNDYTKLTSDKIAGHIENLTSYLSTHGSTIKNTDASAVYLRDADLEVNNSIFAFSDTSTATNATEVGAAVHIEKTSSSTSTPQATIKGSTFAYNKTNDKGAAINTESANMNISEGSLFIGNTAAEHGGAIDSAGALTIDGTKTNADGDKLANIFYNNSSALGGAIFIHDNTTTTSNSNVYDSNTATTQGGGAIHNSGTLVSTGDTFISNKAIEKSGGAISNTEADAGENSSIDYPAGTIEVSNGTFSKNTAKVGGGAIYNTGEATVYGTTTFNQNEAGNVGGAIHNYGGTLNLTDTSKGFTNKSGVQFTNNKAAGGGAVSNTGTVKSAGVTYTSNTATTSGGALYNLGTYTSSNGDTFTSNSAATAGGAIYNGEDATYTSTGDVFENNQATDTADNKGLGGAIYNAGSYTATNSSFTSNSAKVGGAIYNKENSSYTANGHTFTSNSASSAGGAVYNNETFTISNASNFTNNTAAYAGAVYNVGEVISTNSSYSSNKATSTGGGAILNAENATYTANGDTFTSNTAKTHGGAVYNSGTFETKGATSFTGNTAETAGGALYNLGTYTTSTGATFTGNSAVTAGGAVYNGKEATYTATADVFKNNKATGTDENTGLGGAIYNAGEATVYGTITFNQNEAGNVGGAIHNYDGTLNLTDTSKGFTNKSGIQFTNNTAAGGGAISNTGTVKSAGVTYTSNSATTSGGALYNLGTYTSSNGDTFTGNSAVAAGGAIYNGEDATYTSTGDVFENNQATDTADNKGLGGAIYNAGSYTATNSSFTSNSAKVGGAIYNKENSSYTANGHTFASNSAKNHGGAVYNSGTFATTGTTSFTGNVAQYHGGAVYNTGTYTSTGTTYSGNIAGNAEVNQGSGGAIFNAEGATYTSNGDKFINNTTHSYGGAIYNAGTFTLNNAYNSSFSGNQNNNEDISSSAIYNAGTGIFNINNASDTIDLDYINWDTYNENTTIPTISNHKHLFADGQTIRNVGTLNITGSNLQLHQHSDLTKGVINTDKSKVGIINLDDSRIDIGKSTLYTGTINFKNDSELLTHVNAKSGTSFGKVATNNVSFDNSNNTLTIFVNAGEHLNKGQSKTFEIVSSSGTHTGDFKVISENKMYEITALGDGKYQLSRPADTEPEPGPGPGPTPPPVTPDPPYDPTVCPNGDCIHKAWVEYGKIEGHTKAEQIQNTLNIAAQTLGCDSEEYQKALAGVAPDVSPLIQAHSTEITRRLAGVISKQLYSSMERTGYVHRGKRFYKFPRRQSHLWVQGLYGQSEFDSKKGFDMDTQGLAVGFDGHISPDTRLGVAYAYTTADGTAVQRDTEVTSHTISVYGEYNPNRFYANWLGLYTRSNYEENKKVFHHRIKADYDVDVFGAQVMLGRKMGPYVIGNWASGVISPEAGLRYTYIKQHGYTDDAGQKVGAADGQILTGILGAQYTIGYTLAPGLAWYPELRAALTYDFIQPDMENSVTLVNGARYDVVTENLDKFGIEIGARVGLDINRKTEVALEYEGLFKGDYTNHTGLASLKYKF